MKRYLAVAVGAFVTVLAVPVAHAQQTQTNCTISGSTANCDSTTATAYNGGAAMAQAGQDMGKATAAVVAAAQSRRRNADRDSMLIAYALENPEGAQTLPNGKTMSSAEILATAKAYCTVHKKYKSCSLLPKP